MSKKIELAELKKKAKKLYLKSEAFDRFSCGRHLAEYIDPSIGLARQEFSEVWKQIKQLDPSAPGDPYKE